MKRPTQEEIDALLTADPDPTVRIHVLEREGRRYAVVRLANLYAAERLPDDYNFIPADERATLQAKAFGPLTRRVLRQKGAA